jgi:hypothetical protein
MKVSSEQKTEIVRRIQVRNPDGTWAVSYQELYATMSQAGVPAQGSAGEVHESLSHLVCTIKPLEIAKRDGGGADCTFDAAASPAPKSNQ